MERNNVFKLNGRRRVMKFRLYNFGRENPWPALDIHPENKNEWPTTYSCSDGMIGIAEELAYRAESLRQEKSSRIEVHIYDHPSRIFINREYAPATQEQKIELQARLPAEIDLVWITKEIADEEERKKYGKTLPKLSSTAHYLN